MRLEKDLYKSGFATEFLVPDDEPLSFSLDEENIEGIKEESVEEQIEDADFNYLME